MHAYIDSLTRALHMTPRRDVVRVPRSMRPRVTRSTYLPIREESVLRGVTRAY